MSDSPSPKIGTWRGVKLVSRTFTHIYYWEDNKLPLTGHFQGRSKSKSPIRKRESPQRSLEKRLLSSARVINIEKLMCTAKRRVMHDS